MVRGEDVIINGDGETSRDFCYIANVVQVNLLAATVQSAEPFRRAYNIACGERTTLLQLFEQIRALVAPASSKPPVFRAERAGDVRHSLANIDAARRQLGYEPTDRLASGLQMAKAWYARNAAASIVR